MRRWNNVELIGDAVGKFREFLRDYHIKFETSGAGSYTHFEVFVNEEEAEKCNNFLATI